MNTIGFEKPNNHITVEDIALNPYNLPPLLENKIWITEDALAILKHDHEDLYMNHVFTITQSGDYRILLKGAVK